MNHTLLLPRDYIAWECKEVKFLRLVDDLPHDKIVRQRGQEQFEALETMPEVHEASVLIMGVALHLARSLGANPEILAEHWIDTAKKFGAKE